MRVASIYLHSGHFGATIVSTCIEMDTSQMVEETIEPNGGMGHVSAGSGNKLPPRRQYTLEFKRRLVEETFVPGSSVSIVARRHDINSNLVFAWRKAYREGTLCASNKRLNAAASPAQELIPDRRAYRSRWTVCVLCAVGTSSTPTSDAVRQNCWPAA